MNTSANTGYPFQFNLKDLEQTLEKLRGLPKPKWILVSPSMDLWVNEDPMVLARILAMKAMEVGISDV